MIEKNAVRYLKGTIDYGLKYEVNQKINLEGYVDSVDEIVIDANMDLMSLMRPPCWRCWRSPVDDAEDPGDGHWS